MFRVILCRIDRSIDLLILEIDNKKVINLKLVIFHQIYLNLQIVPNIKKSGKLENAMCSILNKTLLLYYQGKDTDPDKYLIAKNNDKTNRDKKNMK